MLKRKYYFIVNRKINNKNPRETNKSFIVQYFFMDFHTSWPCSFCLCRCVVGDIFRLRFHLCYLQITHFFRCCCCCCLVGLSLSVFLSAWTSSTKAYSESSLMHNIKWFIYDCNTSAIHLAVAVWMVCVCVCLCARDYCIVLNILKDDKCLEKLLQFFFTQLDGGRIISWADLSPFSRFDVEAFAVAAWGCSSCWD